MKTRTHQLIVDFIPIIMIYCFATLPKETIFFSNTILGKLVAISIILYYSHLNFAYGFFVCAVVLFYYQSDIVQNTLNGRWEESDTSMYEALEMLNQEMVEMRKQISSPPNTPSQPPVIPTPVGSGSAAVKHYSQYEPELHKYEPAVPYNEQNEDILNGVDKKERLKSAFRKQYCEKGALKLRGEHVKPEMAEQTFGGALLSPHKCNPCDPSCDFSVVEEKLSVEEELTKPKHSNDHEIKTPSWGENLPTAFSQYLPQWNIMTYM